jgi:hypothetical protein
VYVPRAVLSMGSVGLILRQLSGDMQPARSKNIEIGIGGMISSEARFRHLGRCDVAQFGELVIAESVSVTCIIELPRYSAFMMRGRPGCRLDVKLAG